MRNDSRTFVHCSHLLCDARDGFVISGQLVDQRKEVEALCQRLVACVTGRAVTTCNPRMMTTVKHAPDHQAQEPCTDRGCTFGDEPQS